MAAYYILIALSLVAAAHCSPVPKNDTVVVKGQKDKDVSGFFIPLDTWNSLHNQFPPKTDKPLNENPTDSTVNTQVNDNEKNAPNNPIVLPSQNPASDQPMVLQPTQGVLNQDTKTGQMVLVPSNTVQGNQPQDKPIILVQQPAQNTLVVAPQQQNQPLYLQPGQSYVIQNGPNGKPITVNVAIPSYNQGGYTDPQTSQNQGTVYTLVVNNQNQNPSQGAISYPNQNGNAYPSQNVNAYANQNVNSYPNQNGNAYPGQNGHSYVNQNGNSYANQNGNTYPNQKGNSYGNQNGNAYPNQNGNSYANQNGNAYINQNGNAYPNQNGNSYANQNGNGYPSQNGNSYSNQNGNSEPNEIGNIYLVPVQSGSSKPIVLTPVN